MQTPVDVKTARRNAHGIFHADGLDALSGGLGLALMAVFFNDIRHAWALGLGILCFTLFRIQVRNAVTRKRVGYAVFPKPTAKKIVVGITVAILSLAVFYVLGKTESLNWLMPIFVGAFLAGTATVIGYRSGLILYYILAVVFLAYGIAGIIITYLGADPGLVTAVQLWILSLILILVGLIQLIRFLQAYSVPTGEAPADVD